MTKLVCVSPGQPSLARGYLQIACMGPFSVPYEHSGIVHFKGGLRKSCVSITTPVLGLLTRMCIMTGMV
jgi:hypothetical protein